MQPDLRMVSSQLSYTQGLGKPPLWGALVLKQVCADKPAQLKQRQATNKTRAQAIGKRGEPGVDGGLRDKCSLKARVAAPRPAIQRNAVLGAAAIQCAMGMHHARCSIEH